MKGGKFDLVDKAWTDEQAAFKLAIDNAKKAYDPEKIKLDTEAGKLTGLFFD